MKEYLVKVRYALSGLRVYRIKTDNIYRIVGKFVCTSLEHIERIDYSRYTPEREKFWIDEGFTINDYTEPMLSEESPEAFENAVSALEKQIPKKVTTEIDYNGIVWGEKIVGKYVYCPCCEQHLMSILNDNRVSGQKDNYCSKCGQALDWGEE